MTPETVQLFNMFAQDEEMSEIINDRKSSEMRLIPVIVTIVLKTQIIH